MAFPHQSSVLASTFGYHPLPEDLPGLLERASVTRLLAIGPNVPDVVDRVDLIRFVGSAQVTFPRGLYWFATPAGIDVLLVTDGSVPAAGSLTELVELTEDHDLWAAHQWHTTLWESADAVTAPSFAVGDDVVATGTGQDSVVRDRRFTSGSWLYEVRLDGARRTMREEDLSPLPDDDDAAAWVSAGTQDLERFTATLTRAKLEGSFTDTVFSFRATRTLFRPYQFKPVIKLLQTGKSRILVADEVGLGKTIEAGLIWTELEARHSADRVLVVCPSNLVPKWRREMEERFNFTLEELTGPTIADFEERARTGRLPRRAAYIGSLERLRKWEGLNELTTIMPPFDLVIFDEAHYLRNTGTRSNAFGSLVGDLTDNMVFLSATPLNLRSTDLFNLLDLLSPGEFGDAEALEEQLEPNAVLHRVAESLDNAAITSEQRQAMLDELNESRFGRPLARRPELPLLREVLAEPTLTPADIVRARRYLAELNALSAVLTRTRKVEVDDAKALRTPYPVEVQWTEPERAFYREYYAWCKQRADVAGTPIGFSMQMPLRLASACLPAARDAVLAWAGSTSDPVDEDATTSTSASALVPPHPQLLAAATALGAIDTKRDMLLQQVRQLVAEGRQMLLFTFSRPTLAYLKEQLGSTVRVAVLHGGVSKDTRHKIMADFRAGRYDVVLANRVASEGLDFEFCSVVINYDLPWNPMEVEQRIGRIDRIGQQEERIVVVNFHNPETIDERILMMVLDRIGLFERSIGALEPIIASHLTDLQQAMFDFSLTDAQREAKANAVVQAIEAQSAGVEQLASASSILLTSNDVDIRGMEDDLLRTGRYVGHSELQHLLSDWCHIAQAPGVSVSPDGRTMTVRGNAEMARHMQGIVAKGKRTTGEVQELIAQLQSELEINLVLDQELARTGGGTLLTANHPLVLAALSVPGFQNTRYASAQIASANPDIPAGTYLVQLAVAEWGGVRAGREIWGTAVDLDGQPAPDGVAEGLMAHLAAGTLRPATDRIDVTSARDLTARTSQLLDTRQVRESTTKEHEAAALLDSRRVSLASQHERKMRSINKRITTNRERGNTKAIPMALAQAKVAEQRHHELVADLQAQTQAGLQVRPLAVCQLEIIHD